MQKQIITINGLPGSGKSSAANEVAKRLNYQRFSSGDFMRKIAIDMGISINELNLIAEKDKSIDIKIDNEVRKAGEMDKIVIDSRLAFHWIPASFKVYLKLPPEIAKERILKNLESNKLRKESEQADTIEKIYEKIIERLESENKRYLELYGVDNSQEAEYNLVIDTNKNNLDQVVEIIISNYIKWQEKKN